MLTGANAFEISDIERMNIGAHQPGVWHVTMLHALWLAEITIRQGQVAQPWVQFSVRILGADLGRALPRLEFRKGRKSGSCEALGRFSSPARTSVKQ